jgi:hypothetical protein
VPKPIDDDDGHQWIRYGDASELTGVPVGTLHQWVHRGYVATISTGAVTWIDLVQVQDRERRWRHDPRNPRNRQDAPVPPQGQSSDSGESVSPQVSGV